MEGLQMKYFVLNPGSSDPAHAFASTIGVLSYAVSIYGSNPVQGQETYNWAKSFLVDMVNRGNIEPDRFDLLIEKLTCGVVELYPEFRR